MGMGFQAAFWGMALAFGNPCAFLFTKKGSPKTEISCFQAALLSTSKLLIYRHKPLPTLARIQRGDIAVNFHMAIV